jgi:hypothetical protein
VTLRPGDLLLLACAATGVAWSFAALWGGGQADRAVVRVQGRIVEVLPLAHDARVHVRGALGASEIEVRAGRVRVARDPGPRQICVRRGWLARAGDIALCLPNALSVEIPGAANHDSLAY